MHKRFAHQKVRFAAVGISNTALDFTLLNILVVGLGMPALVGNALSVSICILVSYYLNHYFVFQHKQRWSGKSLGLFIGVTGFSSIIIQSLVIWSVGLLVQLVPRTFIAAQVLNRHHALEMNLAKAAAVGTGMVWNFLLYKYVVFRQPRRSCKLQAVTLAGEVIPS